jgi:hypothetical protein
VETHENGAALPIQDPNFEPPSVLVRYTVAEMRDLPCWIPWGLHRVIDRPTGDPRENGSPGVACINVTVPDLCDFWQPRGLRYEGDDAFMLDLFNGDAYEVAAYPSGGWQDARRETVRVRPEVWRNITPWFTGVTLSPITCAHVPQPTAMPTLEMPCGPYRNPYKPLERERFLVLRILVPQDTADDTSFAMRIAYTPIVRIGSSCGFR